MADTWVAVPNTPVVIHFKDQDGKTGKVQYFASGTNLSPTDTGPADLITKTKALSQASLTTAETINSAINTTPAFNGSGPYDLVKDKIQVEFSSADGGRTKNEFPGPVETILATDQLYVDDANSLWLAFISAIKTNCVTAEGSAITGYSLAFRTRPTRVKNQK